MAKTSSLIVIPEDEGIPKHLVPGLTSYVNEGLTTGDFLRCVIAGDLYGAVAHADSESFEALPVIARFILHNFPVGSYGSFQNYYMWCGLYGEKVGLHGYTVNDKTVSIEECAEGKYTPVNSDET